MVMRKVSSVLLAWQVLVLPPLWRLGLLLATDAVFGATSYLFISDAKRFGLQRMQGAPAVPYPGAASTCRLGWHACNRCSITAVEQIQSACRAMDGGVHATAYA